MLLFTCRTIRCKANSKAPIKRRFDKNNMKNRQYSFSPISITKSIGLGFTTVFKAGLIGLGIVAISSYLYKKHMYEKERLDQYNKLLKNGTKLSGVYIQQRQAFPILWYIQWLLPYHQSLKIEGIDGSIRHVGLGSVPAKKSIFDFTSEFVSHRTKKYFGLELTEISVPIECWVDYKLKFGHFPSNVDVEKLKEITMTREEALAIASEKGLDQDDFVKKHIYKTTFGSIMFGIYGKWVMSTCNYALLHAVRTEELARKEK